VILKRRKKRQFFQKRKKLEWMVCSISESSTGGYYKIAKVVARFLGGLLQMV
jgi:23S rRNA C2498 (ribose-2'-O)-methylase RlmM